MAERLKSEEDKWLESMFELQSVRDDGFSRQIVTRIRRRMWVRRLALPIAFVVSIALSTKPLIQLSSVAPELVRAIGLELLKLDSLPLDTFPQLSTVILGAALLVVAMLLGRVFEDA